MLKEKSHVKTYYPNPNTSGRNDYPIHSRDVNYSEVTETSPEPELGIIANTDEAKDRLIVIKEATTTTAEYHQQKPNKKRTTTTTTSSSKKFAWLPILCCILLTALIAFGLGYLLGTLLSSNGGDQENNIRNETLIEEESSSPSAATKMTAIDDDDDETAPSNTIIPFNQKENKVHGNLNYFLKNQSTSNFVISPFAIDYILSFIGNFGSNKEKSAMNEYFEASNVSDVYNYYKSSKKSLFPMETTANNSMINNFIIGNETDDSMNVFTSFDDVSVYPTSNRSYSHHFNEMFRKRLNDYKAKFFSPENFTTPKNTVVGFTFLKYGLEFEKVGVGLARNQIFHGLKGDKYVNLFSTLSKFAEFGHYDLHAIKFKNANFDMFIVTNFKDKKFIRETNPTEILDNLKIVLNSPTDLQYVWIPHFSQQNTIDVSGYFNENLKNQKQSVYAPFNDLNPGEIKYDLNKFYQALRFDLSVDGINHPQSKPYESLTSSLPGHVINNPFIYGVVYETEVLIYYGVYV